MGGHGIDSMQSENVDMSTIRGFLRLRGGDMGEEITEQSLQKQMRKLQVFMEIFGSSHVIYS